MNPLRWWVRYRIEGKKRRQEEQVARKERQRFILKDEDGYPFRPADRITQNYTHKFDFFQDRVSPRKMPRLGSQAGQFNSAEQMKRLRRIEENMRRARNAQYLREQGIADDRTDFHREDQFPDGNE